jgi:hypothetical protein
MIDVTRDTFDQHKHFSRVLMQQGRVQLDSDFNEQTAIVLHYMRTLAADIIGPHGGPRVQPAAAPHPESFGITLQPAGDGNLADLIIGPGRYYVDGIPCENDPKQYGESNEIGLRYSEQPNYPLSPRNARLPDPPYLVYLDVWERHKTALEDPEICEKALGGPDTAARAEVVWQVKVTSEMPEGTSSFPTDKASVEDVWESWVKEWQPDNRGMVKAKAKEAPDGDSDPCVASPEARYRGLENQLYRVEIHSPGVAAQPGQGSGTAMLQQGTTEYQEQTSPTFKWAQDNGIAAFPIRDVDGNTVTLENLGRDRRLGLKVGDWVEIGDDDYVLQGRADPLLRVEEINATSLRVVLSGVPSLDVKRHSDKHPLLRRWDHGTGDSKNSKIKDGALPLRENDWLTLEDGVQIRFQTAEIDEPHIYRTGDHWLIPARTATGDVEWPGDEGKPEARPPYGTQHHYAPLAVVVPDQDQAVDCRCLFEPLCTRDTENSGSTDGSEE